MTEESIEVVVKVESLNVELIEAIRRMIKSFRNRLLERKQVPECDATINP